MTRVASTILKRELQIAAKGLYLTTGPTRAFTDFF